MNKYLIVGLGNIGAEYANTRHNIGFDVLDFITSKNNISWTNNRYATIAQVKIKGKLAIFIKPTTYMNLSGKAVKYWMDKEKIPKENILVIVDDLALPIEKFRLRANGSDAGHNGLKDIQFQLKTDQYPRLRFGIGNVFPKGMQVEFVLGKWKPNEIEIIKNKIVIAEEVVKKFILEGIQSAMNFSNQITVE